MVLGFPKIKILRYRIGRMLSGTQLKPGTNRKALPFHTHFPSFHTQKMTLQSNRLEQLAFKRHLAIENKKRHEKLLPTTAAAAGQFNGCRPKPA
jgi:hypothetical protein